MNLFSSFINDTGGVVYHWRALLYRKRWKNHLTHTKLFLEEWIPSTEAAPKELILIGPSGGYSLPNDWLKKFKSITAYEPDALARKIFELRHRLPRNLKPNWIKEPFQFEKLANGEIKFKENSAILFCNILGQLHFDETAGLLAQEELCKLAQTHDMASYHDILSGDDFRFEWSSPTIEDQPVRVKYETEALDPYFIAKEGLTELDLHVHPASFLFQDEEPFRYQYWEWQITPTQTQVIEGVYSRHL